MLKSRREAVKGSLTATLVISNCPEKVSRKTFNKELSVFVQYFFVWYGDCIKVGGKDFKDFTSYA